MIRNHSATKQPDFVAPPNTGAHPPMQPNHPAAHRRICIPLPANTAPPRRNPPTPNLAPIPRRPTPILHMCQLRLRYDHSTLSTPLRYKQTRSSYDGCRMPLSACRRQPVQHPRPQPRRNPSTTSGAPKSTPCNAFVSYGPDTTMRRMRRLPDTNKFVPATKSVACPYLAGRSLRPGSRPVP